MKVEFIVNADINDGRQIFIQESEFRKAKNNEEEYNSFAFATNCLFAFYGYPDDFINPDEYEKICIQGRYIQKFLFQIVINLKGLICNCLI